MKHSFHIQSKPSRSLLVGLLSALILLPMTSCEDFLNTESSYFSDSTLDNPTDTLYSVVGVINKLQSLSDRTILLGELRGDLSDVTDGANSDLLEIAMFNVSDDNQYNAPHDYYAVINNCNYFLANVDIDMKNNRNEYVFRKEYAVIKAYRAWTYLQLALNYGKVPLVTEPILTQEEAERDYPKMGIQEICEYFIEDLQGLETIEMPGYGTIRNTDSRLFYFPIYVLLGDLNLWAGNYKEAAMNYYNYLNTRNGANVGAPINTNFTRWSADDLRWEVKTSMSGGSGEKYNAQTELVTMFPGDSIPSESQYSRLNDYFNSNQNNDNKVSITASQKLRDLSAAQVYCHMTSASNIIYPPATLEGLDRGDLRLTTNFTEIQRANSTVSLSNKLVTNEKHTSRNVRLYRRTMVYLRLAEALNRAGYPRFAFHILSTGVNNSVIENEVIPYYAEGDAAWLRQFNFPNNQYVLRTKADASDENTYGIHSNGSGWTEYNEYYVFPDDSTLNAEARLAYQIEKVEDLIMDEEALEFAFEGHRYYDLMRVALRRGEPAYLADHVYARRGASRTEDMRSFITKDLTDVNNWYINWNGELGINY
ncbi:MAG: RagB/SusD family nutrient uptake outer membrane protein [Bacteroidaceae bacterium]|nr:RagB/SusD family nutrient uptake outer membrane protein [Bacteroidaceae bacterium]